MGDESVGTIGHIDRTNMSCKRKYTENDDDTGKYALVLLVCVWLSCC